MNNEANPKEPAMQIAARIETEAGNPNGATEYEQRDRLVVIAEWQGCEADSNYGMSWSLGAPSPKRQKLAERLVAAINAGKVFDKPEIRTNVHGTTYVAAGTWVHGRHMNADLRRLGF